MFTAGDVLERVRTQLADTGTDPRWPDSELLYWLNDGLKTMLAGVPAEFSVTATVQLAAGSRQTLPADAHILMQGVRNVTGAGEPRAALRIIDRSLMDSFDPDWHTKPAARYARAYMYTTDNRAEFYVYPPNDGLGRLQLTYAKVPATLTSTADTVPVGDIYLPALTDYVLYRAHMKDGDYAAQQVAQNYLQAFAQTVGIAAQADKAAEANTELRSIGEGRD